jgi:hypothetical protein
MKVRELIGILESVLKPHGDMDVAVGLYFKEDVESLADRKFSDAEWAWLASDITCNWVLEPRDLGAYMEALDEAIADGSVNAGGGRDVWD